MTNRRILSLALLALLSPSAQADTLLVRIGDIDGFGYGAATNFKAANGGNANAQGSTVLTKGDYLPDINKDGAVATGRGDDFDQRSAAEVAGTSYTIGAGVTTATGTIGSQYTDISLSTSYGQSQAANKVLTGGNPGTPDTRVFGFGGPFPSATTAVPNQPGFMFQFSTSSALNSGDPIYLNMIFGDYDVTPANIIITDLNGKTRTLGLTVQPNKKDGLIQAAFATLTYGDVFVGGPNSLNGYLKVDFDAPNEPYTAFDYVELSTQQIDINPVPEPTSLAMLGVGALAAFGLARRRNAAARGA